MRILTGRMLYTMSYRDGNLGRSTRKMSTETNQDAVTAELRKDYEKTLSHSEAELAVIPALTSYLGVQLPMSPGDAAELLKLSHEIGVLFGISQPVALEQLQNIIRADWEMKYGSAGS